MTSQLFLGGPWEGRWVNVDGRYSSHAVPIAPKFFEITHESEISAEPSRAGVATYRRRKGVIPGWRVPLTFWVLAGHDPLGTPGYVLPGYVVGVRSEASLLCVRCRGHRATQAWGVCFKCALGGPDYCAHVWIDGVGNELDRCARCGVPE